jgi:hypothetical protein
MGLGSWTPDTYNRLGLSAMMESDEKTISSRQYFFLISVGIWKIATVIKIGISIKAMFTEILSSANCGF